MSESLTESRETFDFGERQPPDFHVFQRGRLALMSSAGNAVNSDDFSSHVIAGDLLPPAFFQQNDLARTKTYYVKGIERVPDTIQNGAFPEPCRHRQDSLTS